MPLEGAKILSVVKRSAKHHGWKSEGWTGSWSSDFLLSGHTAILHRKASLKPTCLIRGSCPLPHLPDGRESLWIASQRRVRITRVWKERFSSSITRSATVLLRFNMNSIFACFQVRVHWRWNTLVAYRIQTCFYDKGTSWIHLVIKSYSDVSMRRGTNT